MFNISRVGGLAGGAAAAAGGGVGAELIDPHYGNVFLLLGFDDQIDGETTFTDESDEGTAVTPGGQAQIDTEVFKFGTGSVFFDGSGNDWLKIPNTAKSAVSNTTDKTFEGFVYATALAGETQRTIFSRRDSGGAEEFAFYVNPDGNLVFAAWYSGGAISIAAGAGAISTDTWYHVAITRKNVAGTRTWRLFLDGNLEGFVEEPAILLSNTGTFNIGYSAYDSNNRMWQGYMDEIRLTDGVARYTESFTAPTMKFPRGVADPNFDDVVLLIDGAQPGGSGSDANFTDVALLIDGS